LQLLSALRHIGNIMLTRESLGADVFQNFVDGQWAASSSGAVFENRNPANHDDLIGVFQESTPADAERLRPPRVPTTNGGSYPRRSAQNCCFGPRG
jgi:hypothetical protein